jgi:transcriptional regulator with XRE-family HTH domain
LKLRRARRELDKTQNEVANALDWSASKILRIENGTTAVTVSDLIALLSELPNLESERDDLIQLAKESKSSTIVSKYNDVLAPEFSTWLDHEAYAETIWQYEPIIVPGVLQTDEYARAIIEALLNPDIDDRNPDRIIQARRERFTSLMRPNCPRMEIIIDEAAVRRAVGNEDTTRGNTPTIDQINQIKKFNTVGRAASGESIEPDLNPNVAIQIVPLSMGAYRCMRGPFEIIDLGDEDDDQYMMYLENPESLSVVREGRDEIERNIRMFNDLKKRIPSPKEANEALNRIVAELT